MRFKPQRGKFTRIGVMLSPSTSMRFKPQRGKFTRCEISRFEKDLPVSNPNGVNLHPNGFKHFFIAVFEFQTPTG